MFPEVIMKISHITFATSEYQASARLACLSALASGVHSTHIYSPEELHLSEAFHSKNIIDQIDFKERGAGYWLWKPVIILETLYKLPDNEYLLYTDSSVRLKKEFREVLSYRCLDKIHLWSLDQKLNILKSWTDLSVLERLSIPSKLHSIPMILGGVILIHNSDVNRKLIEKWLEMCSDPKLLSPDNFDDYVPSPDLIWHRHDQSLLTILTGKIPERFCISKISQFSLNVFKLPFIVDRRDSPYFLFALLYFEFPRRIIRSLVRLLPHGIRIIIKRLRTKKSISREEFESHKKFY
jgi:hypothetical protein